MSLDKVYREIARNHNITVKEVKRGIERAIKYAYFNGSTADVYKNGIPLNEEFIKSIVMQIIEYNKNGGEYVCLSYAMEEKTDTLKNDITDRDEAKFLTDVINVTNIFTAPLNKSAEKIQKTEPD